MPAINYQELLDISEFVDQNCKACLKYKKLQLKPFVGFSLSKDFNVVAAD